jgi:drug/metabolite transporter (DMT)-like permease
MQVVDSSGPATLPAGCDAVYCGAVEPGTPGSASTRRAVWPHVFLALAPLFWAGNVVLGRALRGSVSPAAITFWRWIIALSLLLPLEGRNLWRARGVLRARWKIILVLGFLGFFLYQALSYQALAETTALNALLISAASPLVVALLGWMVFGERISARLGAGILVSLAGVLVVVTRADPASVEGLRAGRGDLLMLAAVVVWALYSVLLRRRPAELSPLGLVTATALAGMLFSAPVFAWQAATGAGATVSPGTVLALGYIGVFASVLAYVFWNQGVEAIGAARAGLSMNLMPVFGAVLSVVFLGESFAIHHAIGAPLVLAGVLLGSSGLTRRAGRRAPGSRPRRR